MSRRQRRSAYAYGDPDAGDERHDDIARVLGKVARKAPGREERSGIGLNRKAGARGVEPPEGTLGGQRGEKCMNVVGADLLAAEDRVEGVRRQSAGTDCEGILVIVLLVHKVLWRDVVVHTDASTYRYPS